MKHTCKGCFVKDRCYKNYKLGSLRVYYENREGNCPCIKCLVKMVCDSICQDYRTAWNIGSNLMCLTRGQK